ncbi:MAG TPA: AsmA family protein [Terriglobales bacterium]|nr:AsmA family protein [Terriglobales bacterium]
MKNKGLVIVGVILAIVVVIILVIPFFFNANRYKPEIESRLSKSLGRQVTVGDLSLSLFSGGISANNITIADDPAFSRNPFLTAKSLNVGVEMMPLLFHQQIIVQSLVLDNPMVRLLQSGNGKWNVSTLGQQPQASPSGEKQPSSAASNISVGKLQINNGTVDVGQASGHTQSYKDLELKATDFSSTASFPFTLSLIAPQGGKIAIDGKAGPLAKNEIARTPFSANISIENFDLSATGFVPLESGLAGIMNYKGTVTSDGTTVRSEGKAQAAKLRLVKGGSAASQPIQIDYHSNYNLAQESGTIDNTFIHTGKSTMSVSGTYAQRGAATDLNLHVVANQMPTGDIEGLLPAFGVVLPPGSSLQGGTISENLNPAGPSDKLVTTGTVKIENARLAGFSMGKGLSSVAALAGLSASSNTTIQLLSSNVRIAPEGMRFDNLNLVVPEIGSMTGNGTIGADSSLNFQLVAKLNSTSGSGGTANAVGMVTSMLGSKAGGAGIKSIPIHVTGTTSKPVFTPDVGAAVASQLAATPAGGAQVNSNSVGGLVNGLFGGKKKK